MEHSIQSPSNDKDEQYDNNANNGNQSSLLALDTELKEEKESCAMDQELNKIERMTVYTAETLSKFTVRAIFQSPITPCWD